MSKSNQELQVFDQAKADVAEMLARYDVTMIAITDPASAQKAIDIAQDVKGAKKRIEDLRKQLVGPLNERVKAINAYAKELARPIEESEAVIQAKLNEFAAEQRRIALEEQERADKLRKEEEARALAERRAQEAELAAKQEAEAQRAAKANELFGTGEEPIEAVNAQIDEKLTKEWNEDQERLNQEEALRRSGYAQKTYDINQQKVKNTRVSYTVEVFDLALVPKEFLLIEVDEKKAIGAHKLGIPVPGLRFKENINVAIGANTYMPLARR